MAGVLIGLFDHLEDTGRHDATDLSAAEDDELLAFITTNPAGGAASGRAVTRPRCTCAATSSPAPTSRSPISTSSRTSNRSTFPPSQADARKNLRGKRKHDPLPKKTRKPYNERTHTRPATHDEVLITRLASRLVHSRTALHLLHRNRRADHQHRRHRRGPPGAMGTPPRRHTPTTRLHPRKRRPRDRDLRSARSPSTTGAPGPSTSGARSATATTAESTARTP